MLLYFDFLSPVALDKIPNFLANPNLKENEAMPHHQCTIHMNCEDSGLIHDAYLDAQKGEITQTCVSFLYFHLSLFLQSSFHTIEL